MIFFQRIQKPLQRYCRVEKCSGPLYKHTQNPCNGTQPEIFPDNSGIEIGHSECSQPCGGGVWKFVQNCSPSQHGCKEGKIETVSEIACNTHHCAADIKCSKTGVASEWDFLESQVQDLSDLFPKKSQRKKIRNFRDFRY